MKLLSGFLSAVVLLCSTSCMNTSFEGAKPPSQRTKKSSTGEGANGSTDATNAASGQPDNGAGIDTSPASGSFNLEQMNCDDESRTIPAKVGIHKSAQEQVVSLMHICKMQVETESVSSTKHPVDIVFAIDITGSMQPNIDAVKDNVVRFARELESRSWGARFAAVGFTDSVDSQFGFTDADSLSKAMRSWRPYPGAGGDEQEFSQGGIAKALDMLAEDVSRTPGREKADKIVVMVTDNPGFNFQTGRKADFSTNALEQKFQQAAMSLPRLKFYHSTPSSSRFGVSPQEQYNTVINNTGVVGSHLNYPLSEDVILNQFVEKFEPVREKVDRFCRITSLAVRDASGVVHSEAFALKPGDAFQSAIVKKNILPRNSLAQLTGERCCSSSEDVNAACTETKRIQIPFRVN